MRSLERGNGTGGRGEGGFSLIEVMFSVVYVAIGLLGIAAMQDIALSRNVDARRLSVATNLATEMIERIRFNSPANATPNAAGQYPYHNLVACNAGCTNAQVQQACRLCTGTVTSSGPGNTTMNPTALNDFTEWSARLASADLARVLLLTNAIGTVTSTPIGPASLGQVQVTVTLQWLSGLRTAAITMSTIVAPI